MFRRYQLTPIRVIFWIVSVTAVCILLFLARERTRFDVYVGYEIFTEISARKKPADIINNISALQERAAADIAQAEDDPPIFSVIHLLTGLVMFFAPFVVRRDHGRPVRGFITLPLMAFLCYLFAVLTNMVVSAGAQLALHSYVGTKPGPGFFISLVTPLHLFWPTGMGSAYGTASQIIYIIYICSVLTTKGRKRAHAQGEEAHHAEQDHLENELSTEQQEAEDVAEPTAAASDGSNETACALELDRLCRIIDGKFGDKQLTHAIHTEVRDHINTPNKVEEDIRAGIEPYRIVLLSAAKCIRRAIDDEPSRTSAHEAFLYIIDEMQRMEYCSDRDCTTLRSWLELKRRS